MNICKDYDKLEQTIASYEIDRVNLVVMTLERDEFDEANKKLAAELKSYKQWFKEREETMLKMEGEIKRLEREFNHAANACARQTELLGLADAVVRSLKNVDTINKMQIIISNYLNDPMK